MDACVACFSRCSLKIVRLVVRPYSVPFVQLRQLFDVCVLCVRQCGVVGGTISSWLQKQTAVHDLSGSWVHYDGCWQNVMPATSAPNQNRQELGFQISAPLRWWSRLMLPFLLLLLLLLLLVTPSKHPDSRVISGSPCQDSEWLWQFASYRSPSPAWYWLNCEHRSVYVW